MAWYSAGSVQVTNNSNAVTGTGTDFIANTRVGDGFLGPDGRLYQITNAASATSLSISPNYLGTTAGAQPYKIIPVQGYNAESARLMREIIVNWGTQLSSIQPWAYAPTEADARDALDVPSNSEIDTRLGTTGNLGNAALATVATSQTDSTSNRLTPVGYYGLGTIPPQLSDFNTDPSQTTGYRTGFFYTVSGAANLPLGQRVSGVSLRNATSGSEWRLGGIATDTASAGRLFYSYRATGGFQNAEVFHSHNQIGIGATAESARTAIDSSVLPSYTVATVPSVAANPNKLIVVTNAAAGRNSYLSDGTNWRNPDRVILS